MIALLLLNLPFYAQSLELESQNFYICSYKTATQIKSRSLRTHYFPKENKCAVFYTVKGEDKIIASGRWKTFCETKTKEVVENLEKERWSCKSQKEAVKVFYPFEKEKSSSDNTNLES